MTMRATDNQIGDPSLAVDDDDDFAAAYAEMAHDERREAESAEWIEALVADVSEMADR